MNNVIIIGASSGIGRLIAETYIKRGCRVGIAARRLDPLEELRRIAPDRVITAKIDVTEPDAGLHLAGLIRTVGDVDLIFNVAGVGFANPDLNEEKESSIVATNCDGFTRIVDTAFRYFADRRKGHLAAITSIAGTKGLGLAAAYSASKSYQATYLAALAQLATIRGFKQLYITDIRPGFIDTDLLDHSRRYPMLMGSEYAVRKIIAAVDRRRRVAVIDWRWNIVVGLWRLIPACLWRRLKVKF